MGNTIPAISASSAVAHHSASAVATTVKNAFHSMTPELAAARLLFSRMPVASTPSVLQSGGGGGVCDSLVASSSSMVASIATMTSPLLVQARQSYSNFLLQDESLKLALPASFFAGATSTFGSTIAAAASQQSQLQSSITSSVSKVIKNALFALLRRIREHAQQLSTLLVSVATFALKNPRIVLAGSVGFASVAGVAYFLVIKQDVIRQYFNNNNRTTANNNNDNDPDALLFSELEQRLIRQKMQSQADFDHDHSTFFCPIENARRNAHASLHCPITMELFNDPVFVTSSGHTFERSAITQWILDSERQQQQQQQGGGGGGGGAVCPVTRIPIQLEHLVPNLALKQSVLEYLALLSAASANGNDQAHETTN